jgi:predicted RNA-binding Zn-ribbon protein involved in translation (DUF1610 family)
MNGYTYRVRSQPDYPPFAWDSSGARHLLVIADCDPAEAALALAAPPAPGALEILTLEALDGSLQVRAHAAAARVHSAPTLAGLLGTLRACLQAAQMGLRIYVLGSEDSCWQCRKASAEFGMTPDEVQLVRSGTLARPVYCVHCGTHLPAARSNVAQCTGCSRFLLVRDHFSRRLGAYMGLQVDAEQPGRLPPIHEVFP